MVKKVLGVSLDELGISIINIRSTGFENVAQVFNQDRINRKCSILTDLDAEICDTTILPDDINNTKIYKTKVRNSSVAGRQRKEKLEEFAKGNSYVKILDADYTFEVDFVKVGNAWEVIQTLDKVYAKSLKDKASKELESGDPAIYGKRVLTMAKREGKGWFAILVGKHISFKTIIPLYVLNAIVFAKQSFNDALIYDIIVYRLISNKEDDEDLNIDSLLKSSMQFRQGKIKLKSVISEIEKQLPDDQVINFLKLL